jgi:NhaA family Na+:H+ antiporter
VEGDFVAAKAAVFVGSIIASIIGVLILWNARNGQGESNTR